MNYAVLGKDGLLGQAVEKELRRQKLSFRSFSRNALDITQPDAIKRSLPSFSVWINCAAYTQVPLAEKERTKAWEINVEGPKNLAIFAQKWGAKLIHFSTDYVFDGRKKTPYQEQDATAPLNVYGETKRAGEKKLLLLHKNALIVRTSWLFSWEKTCFLTKIFQAAETKTQLRVVCDQQGRPTCAEDLAAAALLLQNEQGLFHFANQGACSWYDFAQEILALRKKMGSFVSCRKMIPISSKEQEVIRPLYSVLATDMFENTFGPIRHWKQALYSTYPPSLCL